MLAKNEILSPFLITIDGHAGAGKGTLARYLAEQFNLKHLDTGALFRLLAFKCQQLDIVPDDSYVVVAECRKITCDDQLLSSSQLRNEDVANFASKIAIIPEVRAILLELQRQFCRDVSLPYCGAVLDGRDIGTVVLPYADCKFFITASEDARTQRRQMELQQKGALNNIHINNLQERDQRDQQRKVAPLEAAKDALVIDTTSLTINQVYDIAKEYVLDIYRTKKVA